LVNDISAIDINRDATLRSFIINDDGGDYDSRMEGDTNANLFYLDAGNDRIGIGTSSPSVFLDVAGALTCSSNAVINEGGTDLDSRIEGSGDANLIYTDAGNDRVGIGTATPANKLEVNGELKATTANLTSIMATGSGGLKFVDDSETYGLFIEDGGFIGVVDSSPDFTVDVSGDIRVQGANYLYFGGTGAADNDTNLYRGATDNLKTDDSLTVTEGIDAGANSTFMKCIVIEMGDWDMPASDNASFAHGIADHKKIRMVSYVIRDDNDVNYYTGPTKGGNDGDSDAGFDQIDSTNIQIWRETGGLFNDAAFNATSYNRGWITVWYES